MRRIPFPNDLHIHLRDGSMMRYVSREAAKKFNSVVVMPNLSPPITKVSQALKYRRRIVGPLKDEFPEFNPLMTLYLTNKMTPDNVAYAKESGIFGIKLYPFSTTTGAEYGIKDINKMDDVFYAMQQCGLPLLVHGELSGIDIFDREAAFIDQILTPLIKKFPKLRISLEHITTEAAVEFIKAAPNHIVATITPHHLYYNRNDLFTDKRMQPHKFCMPIFKREQHRRALIEAATSGHPRFFLGTDSAPHDTVPNCGCAGCYNTSVAMAIYAEIFEKANALDKLEQFIMNGSRYYELPKTKKTMTLIKEKWTVPSEYVYDNSLSYTHDNSLSYTHDNSLSYTHDNSLSYTHDNSLSIKPMAAGEILSWRIEV